MKRKFEIGDIVKIKGCSVKIVGFNRERKHLRYVCECLECGAEYPKDSSILDERFGCPCCGEGGAMVVKKEVNSVWKTNPEIVGLFANEEDSWYVSIGSRKECLFKCPICEKEHVLPVKYIAQRKSVPCKYCEDRVSFGEAYVGCLLNILGIDYKREVSTRTLKWASGKRYDFYIESFNTIIETHGIQHYEEMRFKEHKRRRTLKEEQENDRIKEALAKKNGIKHYIVIDCRESTVEYVKDSILNNPTFKELFLKGKTVNWELLNEELKGHSKFKEVLDMWNSGETTIEVIAELTGLGRDTCRNYLKKASDMGKCEFDTKKNAQKVLKEPIKVLCEETGRTYNSISECARDMTKMTGEKFYSSEIGKVVRGVLTQYKGFYFKKVSDVEYLDIERILKFSKSLIQQFSTLKTT